jgi:Tfp pilus assembly protein PilO
MTAAALAAWLWDNRRVVAEAAGIAAIVSLVWWFGFHIPAERDLLQAQNQELKAQVQAAQGSVTLQGDIQHEKQTIDKVTQQRISSLRVQPHPAHHGVLVPAGRLPDLPTLRPAHTAH